VNRDNAMRARTSAQRRDSGWDLSAIAVTEITHESCYKLHSSFKRTPRALTQTKMGGKTCHCHCLLQCLANRVINIMKSVPPLRKTSSHNLGKLAVETALTNLKN